MMTLSGCACGSMVGLRTDGVPAQILPIPSHGQSNRLDHFHDIDIGDTVHGSDQVLSGGRIAGSGDALVFENIKNIGK